MGPDREESSNIQPLIQPREAAALTKTVKSRTAETAQKLGVLAAKPDSLNLVLTIIHGRGEQTLTNYLVTSTHAPHTHTHTLLPPSHT